MSPRAALALVLVPAGALLSGCAANVGVVFDFPTTRAFEISELIQLDVVRIAPDALGSCPAVLESALRGDTLDVVVGLEATDVCAVEAGVAVPDPGSGPLAFVAQVIDDRNSTILAGCTIAEAYPGAPPVRIELYPTAGYTVSVERLSDADTRAGGACGGGG